MHRLRTSLSLNKFFLCFEALRCRVIHRPCFEDFSSLASSHVKILSFALSSFLICSYYFFPCHHFRVLKLSPPLVFHFSLFRISKLRLGIGFISVVVLHRFCFSPCFILILSHLGLHWFCLLQFSISFVTTTFSLVFVSTVWHFFFTIPVWPWFLF
jgi:hypothetical protein